VQVDAGPEFRLQCLREEIPAIDLFILTHGHADHILGMDDLRRFCDLRHGEAISVYSTEEGLGRVRAVFPYAICENSAGTGYAAFAPQLMPPTLQLKSGSKIEAVLLPHGRMETLGLVFFEKSTGAKFAYFSDCKTVAPRALELAKGADVVTLEALRFREHPTHMSVAEAAEVAKKIGGRQTFLTHTTCEIDYRRDSPELAKLGLALAYDGLRLKI
jgi:phosphoribosyl 1,2-cyclic phosphate phosphodiesterase